MTDIVIISPMDAPMLGLTLQSLFVTCPYSEIRTSVFLRGQEDPQSRELLDSLEGRVSSRGKKETLSKCLEEISTIADPSSVVIIVPPGATLLKEGWADLISKLFRDNPNLAIAATEWQEIGYREGRKRYPSYSGLFAFRAEIFPADPPSRPTELSALLLERAACDNRDIADLPGDSLFVYESALPLIPLGSFQEEWARAAIYIEKTKGVENA